MSEQLDQEDKTEDPSERRLDEARKEGRVALSRDAVLIGALTAGTGALFAVGAGLGARTVGALRTTLGALGDEQALEVIGPALLSPALLGLGVVAAAALAATVATAAQTRGGFWLELLTPKAERLFSLQRLTHAFTREGLADLGLAALKAALLLGAAASALGPALRELGRLYQVPSSRLLEAAWTPLVACLPRLLVALVALAALDLWVVRRRHLGRLRMSKDELRREHKEDEGDPHIRGRRRRKHREMAQGRVAVEVPRADALVVNPTHIAVAIRYRKKNDKAPRVTAKGKGKQAEIMRELAVQHGIPIVRDVPLARLVYRKVKVGREVPAETFRAVAAVLATVYRLTGRVPGTGAD